VQRALHSRSFNRNLHNARAWRNPAARTGLVAAAAAAGWHGHHGWWRHGHGGYGWVGPVFWPFAFYDLNDYAFWGYGYDPSFWDYGYSDIYAGLFSPYGYDAMVGYLPSGGSGSRVAASPSSKIGDTDQADNASIAPLCGSDSSDVAGVPVDKIQQSLQLSDDQRTALNDLASASTKAADGIRASCPTAAPLTAPARLTVMENRIQAMAVAVQTVQPPLDKFYGMLSDDQKAKLNGLAQDQARKQDDDRNADKNCGIASMSDSLAWPTDVINERLKPTDAQKIKLTALQDATFKAADSLKNSCQPSMALTPPARLAAAGQRLDALLAAVKSVHASLDDFYGTLSDEQKAQFEAIGPDRGIDARQANAAVDDDDSPAASGSRRHHRRHAYGVRSVEGAVRRLIRVIP